MEARTESVDYIRTERLVRGYLRTWLRILDRPLIHAIPFEPGGSVDPVAQTVPGPVALWKWEVERILVALSNPRDDDPAYPGAFVDAKALEILLWYVVDRRTIRAVARDCRRAEAAVASIAESAVLGFWFAVVSAELPPDPGKFIRSECDHGRSKPADAKYARGCAVCDEDLKREYQRRARIERALASSEGGDS